MTERYRADKAKSQTLGEYFRKRSVKSKNLIKSFIGTRSITPNRVTSLLDPSLRNCVLTTLLFLKKGRRSGEPLETLGLI